MEKGAVSFVNLALLRLVIWAVISLLALGIVSKVMVEFKRTIDWGEALRINRLWIVIWLVLFFISTQWIATGVRPETAKGKAVAGQGAPRMTPKERAKSLATPKPHPTP